MKKLIITSVAALSVIGSAGASVYIGNPDTPTADWGNWVAAINAQSPETAAAVNNLATALNSNTAEFDQVNLILSKWNKYLFGESYAGGTVEPEKGLFYGYYHENGGVQARLAALENGTVTKLSHEINKVSKELSAGVANVAALSAVAVSDVKQGEVSFGGGYGYHNSQSAVAFGTAVGLTDNWSMNAGVGFNDYDVTVRAGTNVKFKLF